MESNSTAQHNLLRSPHNRTASEELREDAETFTLFSICDFLHDGTRDGTDLYSGFGWSEITDLEDI